MVRSLLNKEKDIRIEDLNTIVVRWCPQCGREWRLRKTFNMVKCVECGFRCEAMLKMECYITPLAPVTSQGFIGNIFSPFIKIFKKILGGNKKWKM